MIPCQRMRGTRVPSRTPRIALRARAPQPPRKRTGDAPMKTPRLPALLLAFALLPVPALADSAQEEANKKIVLDFYEKAINQKDFAAASVHLGTVYKQHNPLAADGPEGLKAFLEYAKKNLATYHTEFK